MIYFLPLKWLLAIPAVCARLRESALLQLNNPATGGDGHRLRAMCRSKFFHDVLDMNLDRLLRDEEFLGDVPVPIPTGDMAQHIRKRRQPRWPVPRDR